MKLEDIFATLPKPMTDEQYRTTGIHSSDLQSIYLNEVYKINPETRAEVSEEIGRNPKVIAGCAFEDYIEDPIKLNAYHVITMDSAPVPAMMLPVINELILTGDDPNNIQLIASIIQNYGIYVSDKSEKAKVDRATLDFPTKLYIAEQRNLRTVDQKKIITSEVRKSIIESEITLSKKYPELTKDVIGDFFQVVLEYEGISIKIDRLLVYEDLSVKVLDYKFKDADPSNWASGSYWKYGYWIQAVLYSHVTKMLLKPGIRFKGFDFVIGSRSNPEKSTIVKHPTAVNDLMYEDFIYDSGYVIKSIATLTGELDWHRTNNIWNISFDKYMNGNKDIPVIPKLMR